jgi:hypothetical protein
MLYSEVLVRYEYAKALYEKLDIKIDSYIVAMFGGIQVMPEILQPKAVQELFDPDKDDLLKIFLPNQAGQRRAIRNFSLLVKTGEDKHRVEIIRVLEKLEFLEVRYELRFKSLDIKVIQSLKKHPLVKAIEQVEESAVCIRVVIA